jgi:hypothetical protein
MHQASSSAALTSVPCDHHPRACANRRGSGGTSFRPPANRCWRWSKLASMRIQASVSG